jgi:hypothetical protein
LDPANDCACYVLTLLRSPTLYRCIVLSLAIDATGLSFDFLS